MACHIAAASGGSGARRYVAEMKTEERRSIHNGIWMCYLHGKIIDTDEVRYSIPMLKRWKQFAEFRAQHLQAFGEKAVFPVGQMLEIGILQSEVTFSQLGTENVAIGNLIADSCLFLVWGNELADAVRDLTVEYTRNALTHGKASTCVVSTNKKSLSFVDDGFEFNWLDLEKQSSKGGGAQAVRRFLRHYGGQLIVSTQRTDGKNKTSLALAINEDDVDIANPCVMYLQQRHVNDIKKRGVLPQNQLDTIIQNQCRIVYVVAPLYMSPSDAATLGREPAMKRLNSTKVVFVFNKMSKLVKDMLDTHFPGCSFLELVHVVNTAY